MLRRHDAARPSGGEPPRQDPRFAAGGAPGQPPPYGQQPYGPPPYAQPPYGAPAPAQVGSENAVIALIASVFGLFCCGPISIVGVVLGYNARNEANRTNRPLDGTMNAAWIIGIIAIVLWLAITALWGLGFFAAVLESSNSGY